MNKLGEVFQKHELELREFSGGELKYVSGNFDLVYSLDMARCSGTGKVRIIYYIWRAYQRLRRIVYLTTFKIVRLPFVEYESIYDTNDSPNT